MKTSRREFIKKLSLSTAAVSIGGVLPGFSAKSYRNIVGANERFHIAVMGVNSRGQVLANNFAMQPNAVVTYICDVDRRAIDKCFATVTERQSETPKKEKDFRKALEDKQVDALVIAAPDHWHAPATVMALKAGKHVYVEKPCSHNPREGELLIETVKKYKHVVQIGNQRRSWPNVVEAIKALHNGVIGRVYFARTWYTNNRPSIGIGKQIAVPDWLDYELWQGPAPRRPYKDNILHYNWHWFWHWGTGEALNNGTHFVDLARWGLQADYPTKVTSVGGRYRYKDDWETPDTQTIGIEFGNGCSITWEGRSCNGAPSEGAAVGVIFYGEQGSLQIGSGNTYKIYDLKGKLIKEAKNDIKVDARSLSNPSQNLDAIHIQNFFSAIKDNTPLNSDIVEGHKSTLLVQLGNIAQRTTGALDIDASTGRILRNEKAMKLWSREYERGWELKI